MEDNYRYQLSCQPVEKPAKVSRLGLRHTGGEIVEVQGGHIVRSTGLKDRHSKVCTAKGPRDRRVRLSAHTAIQFYDVQDRLGYDRPSKAVDWLIKKAKAAIDELAELPAWTPTAGAGVGSTPVVDIDRNPDQDDGNIVDNQMGCSQNSRFLPESLDSVKSFFPATPAVNVNNNNNMNFPPANNNNYNNQDLKLSLQSFQDPIPHHQPGNNIYFDGSGWPENGGFSGFVFNSPPTAIPTAIQTQTTPFLQPLFGQPTNNQLLNYISQRGPLQSSNSPPVRAWVDPLPFAGAGMYPHQTLGFNNPPSIPGYASGMGGFSGFDIPARIRGDEEEHDGLSDKPSSGSSDSRH